MEWGGVYPGGLITGCSFWFTGGWAYNWGGGLISSNLQYTNKFSLSMYHVILLSKMGHPA